MAGENTTIVLIGATGDLAQRSLVPALFHLRCTACLAPGVRIVGFARRPYSDEEFRDFMWQGTRELGELAARREEWDSFVQNLFYVSGNLDKPEDFARLGQRLEELEAGPANRLFYFSIPPQHYETAVNNLGGSGLAREDTGWRRLVIEKPFGRDLASAQMLDREIQKFFDAHQVFRTDHFLGKETVQNVLVFRFGNAIFEPLWNRNYVDSVQITVAERIAVGKRGAFYENSGVVRDMIQNHLFQLLAMVAMEPPVSMDADSMRNKKVEVLKAIRHWAPSEIAQHAVLGQYRGYREEDGVAPDSNTATYAALRFYVDNWRWQGVPFYLRTGKTMAETLTEIVIVFRSPPFLMFSLAPGQALTPNILGLCLQPDQGVHLRFEVKVPGQGMNTRSVDMEFHYESEFKSQELPEAYERLLEDALNGDPSLFTRTEFIDEAWRIVDPLLEDGERHPAFPPHIYEPGSWGPQASDDLLAKEGRSWARGCGAHGGEHA